MSIELSSGLTLIEDYKLKNLQALIEGLVADHKDNQHYEQILMLLNHCIDKRNVKITFCKQVGLINSCVNLSLLKFVPKCCGNCKNDPENTKLCESCYVSCSGKENNWIWNQTYIMPQIVKEWICVN